MVTLTIDSNSYVTRHMHQIPVSLRLCSKHELIPSVLVVHRHSPVSVIRNSDVTIGGGSDAFGETQLAFSLTFPAELAVHAPL